MPKQGTEYELFVKDVYERLNAVDGLSDVKIQHDVKLSGAAGVEHKIDIYWTFYKGGVNYKVAIECKDYNSRVSKDRIQSFHDVLHDIGNIHGIFVSKTGFQSGAIEYAQKYGIQLMEIRHPTENDWKGRMRNLQFNIEMYSIDNIKPRFIIDQERIKDHDDRLIINDKLSFRAMNNQVFVEFDEMTSTSSCDGLARGYMTISEKSTKSIYELINMLPRREAKKGIEHIFEFINGVVRYTNKESKKTIELPLKQIVFTYDAFCSSEQLEINGDDVIKTIVKDLSDGTQKTIDRFGQITIRENM